MIDQGALDETLRNLIQGKSTQLTIHPPLQLSRPLRTRQLLIALIRADRSKDNFNALYYLNLLKFKGVQSAEQNQLCLEVVMSLLSDVNSVVKFNNCRLLLERLLEREKMQKLDKDKSYVKGVSRFLQILQDRPQHLTQLLDHFASRKFILVQGTLREIR